MKVLRKIAVGLSGGVDSAVTALLVKQRGFIVKGVFMKNWDESDETGTCTISRDRDDAKYVCDVLRIEFHEVNFVKQYWSEVFSYFLKDYESGFTPNPDILCNRHIKFNLFLNYCLKKLNADAVATGHYALTSYGPYLENSDLTRPVRLLEAADTFKDQTFFLSQVPQESLVNVMFPLGSYFKSDVKEIATKNHLHRIRTKKESTGICFIGKRNFQEFISDYIPFQPGPVQDLTTGDILKEHSGIHLWTIGQCCRIKGFTSRYYVTRKDPQTNTIYVVPGTNHPALFTSVIFTSKPHWIASVPFNSYGMAKCRFRFQHTKPTVPCQIFSIKEGLVILLERPLKSITPGQFAVFYQHDECLGSARILYPGPSLFLLEKSVPLDYREYEHFNLYQTIKRIS